MNIELVFFFFFFFSYSFLLKKLWCLSCNFSVWILLIASPWYSLACSSLCISCRLMVRFRDLDLCLIFFSAVLLHKLCYVPSGGTKCLLFSFLIMLAPVNAQNLHLLVYLGFQSRNILIFPFSLIPKDKPWGETYPVYTSHLVIWFTAFFLIG